MNIILIGIIAVAVVWALASVCTALVLGQAIKEHTA